MPSEETVQQKNERILALYSELGAAIGPIVERETSTQLPRAINCVDCLLTHVTEILVAYYALNEEDAKKCYKMMKNQVQQYIKEVQIKHSDKLPEGTIIKIPGENNGN